MQLTLGDGQSETLKVVVVVVVVVVVAVAVAVVVNYQELEMWPNAQRDGRPAEYRWRHLFNAAKFG